MAADWWKSADGVRDELHRERCRVLKSLAERALSRVDQLEVGDLSAPAVDALVSSETLRDLGNDRVNLRVCR